MEIVPGGHQFSILTLHLTIRQSDVLRGGGFFYRYGFHIQRDFDVFADEHAARFQRLIPGKAEVFAVDLGVGGEAGGALLGEGVDLLTQEFNFHADGLRHAANGQVAGDDGVVVVFDLHAGALERDRRVILNIQEIRAAQVTVTIIHTRPDAGGVDGRLHARSAEILRVKFQRAGNILDRKSVV